MRKHQITVQLDGDILRCIEDIAVTNQRSRNHVIGAILRWWRDQFSPDAADAPPRQDSSRVNGGDHGSP